MGKKSLIVLVLLIAGFTVWYLFRPERLFVNENVSESFPAQASAQTASSTLLSSGMFHSVAHETKGAATIYQLADGKRVLRFTDFETSNGPDVQVYLVAAGDATDNDTVTKYGFIHVGALKGNIGDQNYELPSNLDLNKYRAVTVWCRRFGVNFGTAPLMQKQS